MIIDDRRKETVPLALIEQGEFFETDDRIFLKLHGGVYNRQEEMEVFCISMKMVQLMNPLTLVTPLPHIRIVIER